MAEISRTLPRYRYDNDPVEITLRISVKEARAILNAVNKSCVTDDACSEPRALLDNALNGPLSEGKLE